MKLSFSIKKATIAVFCLLSAWGQVRADSPTALFLLNSSGSARHYAMGGAVSTVSPLDALTQPFLWLDGRVI
jgi:hypothetical protein